MPLLCSLTPVRRSPLGYEQYDEVSITRQVVIGGKNKYLINGANVQVGWNIVVELCFMLLVAFVLL